MFIAGFIIGSILSMCFFLGGMKLTREYVDEKIEKVKESFTKEENATFYEPVTDKEIFLKANSIDETLNG
jgi:uncharacterized membrane protein YciS (DUF1049 family)